MDYLLKIKVWINYQSLIQSGEIGKGKIVIDGGYSRFYCEEMNAEEKEIFDGILRYLD